MQEVYPFLMEVYSSEETPKKRLRFSPLNLLKFLLSLRFLLFSEIETEVAKTDRKYFYFNENGEFISTTEEPDGKYVMKIEMRREK